MLAGCRPHVNGAMHACGIDRAPAASSASRIRRSRSASRRRYAIHCRLACAARRVMLGRCFQFVASLQGGSASSWSGRLRRRGALQARQTQARGPSIGATAFGPSGAGACETALRADRSVSCPARLRRRSACLVRHGEDHRVLPGCELHNRVVVVHVAIRLPVSLLPCHSVSGSITTSLSLPCTCPGVCSGRGGAPLSLGSPRL